MKTANYLKLAVALVMLIGINLPTYAAEPATLWSFLGIPQGVQKLRDVGVNRRGNLPKFERKPPLKRIAAPENLKSEIKAIEVAAKIKTQEDMAPQKIKAIKYLATIGCGCYPDVQEALLKSLDDCTEEVRYEAAIAFRDAAGDPCEACGSSCCNAAVMTKLHKMAYGQDEKRCAEEASARVRAAAEQALNACRERFPAPEAAENGVEYPTEAPPVETPPDDAGPPFIEERDLEKMKKPVPPPGDQTSTIINPISFTRLPETGEAEITDDPAVEEFGQGVVGCGPGRYSYGGPGRCVLPDESALLPDLGAADLGDAGAEQRLAPPLSAFASALGAASGPQAGALNMIGDVFGGGTTFPYDKGYTFSERPTMVPLAGSDRRFKIAENNNPIPTDRVFFNFNHFENALYAADGTIRSLDRFTFGVEKTFWDQRCSVELRIPFASGLNSDQLEPPGAQAMSTEFGNLVLALKAIVRQRGSRTLSAGLGIGLPTADDAQATLDTMAGNRTWLVKNQSVHLQPFVGWLWVPNDCWFVEAFAELDVDTNGNEVYEGAAGQALVFQGTLHDQNLLLIDLTVGRYLYRNPNACWLTGIAPVVELHYTSTMQNAASVAGITNLDNRMDILNITGGIHFQFGQLSTLTVAGVAPLRGGEENLFDAEVLVQFNRRF